MAGVPQAARVWYWERFRNGHPSMWEAGDSRPERLKGGKLVLFAVRVTGERWTDERKREAHQLVSDADPALSEECAKRLAGLLRTLPAGVYLLAVDIRRAIVPTSPQGGLCARPSGIAGGVPLEAKQ